MILPFGIAELATRCDLALRRYHKAIDKDPVMRTGPLTIDLVSRAVAQLSPGTATGLPMPKGFRKVPSRRDI
jgi:DNA-binding response OmpR family regulator